MEKQRDVVRRPPHPLDIHIGRRLRERRKYLNISQQELAKGIGRSHQLIQKYEQGKAGITSRTLFAIAVMLDVPTSYFFSGLSEAKEACLGGRLPDSISQAVQLEREGQELGQAWRTLRDHRARGIIKDLVYTHGLASIPRQ